MIDNQAEYEAFWRYLATFRVWWNLFFAIYKGNIGKWELQVFFKLLANLSQDFDRTDFCFYRSVIDEKYGKQKVFSKNFFYPFSEKIDKKHEKW